MNTNLNMQTMPIDRLKPAKYNPRKDLKPGDPAYEKIKRSLHDFGYVDPMDTRTSGTGSIPPRRIAGQLSTGLRPPRTVASMRQTGMAAHALRQS